ncbi:MAG: cell shape-determining protein MreC [Flavobacteriaceae bacterium]|jgi:cell shape-determining protein MreC
MMNYRRNKSNIDWKIVLISCIGLFFIISFFSPSLRLALSNASRNILGVLVGSTNETFLLSRHSLIQERDEFKNQALENETYKTENDILLLENDTLRSIIEGKNTLRAVGDLSLSRIISTPPRSPYDVLIVDGSYNIGSNVYALGKVRIGTVTKTSRFTSEVTLVSSPGVSTEALLEIIDISETQEEYVNEEGDTVVTTSVPKGEGVVSVELEGRGNGELFIKLPHEVTLSEGALIFENKNSSPLGKVSRIVSDDRDPFQNVYAVMLVNPRHLQFVQVEEKTEIDRIVEN